MSDINDTVIPRRSLLQMGACAGGAAIVGIALAPIPARAETDPLVPKKSSKLQAGYRESASQGTCSSCWHFRAPDACRVVEGTINQQGRCLLYATKAVNTSV
jgi:hypothetical protein